MNNPEFLRHLWLEMSLHRLIGLPVIIVLICLMAWLPDHSRGALTFAAISMVILLVVWGMHLVAESLFSEFRGNTWHAQRMSALSPWQLASGKLFGSSLFAWLGIALCLMIYLFAKTEPDVDVLSALLLLVLASLFMQALVLLLCLATMRLAMSARYQSFAYVLLVLIFFMPVFVGFGESWNGNINWYAHEIPTPWFAIICTLVFYGWVLAGIQRLMGAELQLRYGTGVWLGFLISFLLLTSGCISDISLPGEGEHWLSHGQHYSAFATAIALLIVYVMLLFENTTTIQAKRWLMALREGNWQALYQATPCWLTTLLVALICLLVLAIQTIIEPDMLAMSMVLLTCLLFVLRDSTLLLWVRFRSDYRPAHMTAMIIYIFCSYIVLPIVFSALEMHLMLPWFVPGIAWQWGWVCVIIELAVTGRLLLQRCRRLGVLG